MVSDCVMAMLADVIAREVAAQVIEQMALLVDEQKC